MSGTLSAKSGSVAPERLPDAAHRGPGHPQGLGPARVNQCVASAGFSVGLFMTVASMWSSVTLPGHSGAVLIGQAL